MSNEPFNLNQLPVQGYQQNHPNTSNVIRPNNQNYNNQYLYYQGQVTQPQTNFVYPYQIVQPSLVQQQQTYKNYEYPPLQQNTTQNSVEMTDFLPNYQSKYIQVQQPLQNFNQNQYKSSSKQQQQPQNYQYYQFSALKDIQNANSYPNNLYPDYSLLQYQNTQKNNIQQQAQEQKENIKYSLHEIQKQDTLMSISIQYGVSMQSIKSFNKLDGNEIYFLKEIKIPEPKTNLKKDLIEEDPIEEEKLEKIQKLENFTQHILIGDDKDKKMALYYLDDCEWDFRRAAHLYYEHLEWDKQQKKLLDEIKKKRKKPSKVNQLFENWCFCSNQENI